MQHPAELRVTKYLSEATKGENTPMSEATIETVANDIKEALTRQFGGGNKRDKFSLRMSNIGRPTCQLYHDKHSAKGAEPFPSSFMMNMMIGDIVEAVFKGILTEAGVEWEQPEKVTLKLPSGAEIKGTDDLTIDGKVDDVKSASAWSYKNKFDSYESLASHDDFGYVAQLAGYAKAKGVEAGGWWVINKATGEFKYVKADMDVDAEVAKIDATVQYSNSDKFERCFDAEVETFRRVPTGHHKLGFACGFCKHKYTCWKTVSYEPSRSSQAKEPPMVYYVEPDKEAW